MDSVKYIGMDVLTIELPMMLVVEWACVGHRSESNVPGAAGGGRRKIVAEVETLPIRHTPYDCSACPIGQTEGVTNRLPRQGKGTNTRRIHDRRGSSQIEPGILPECHQNS